MSQETEDLEDRLRSRMVGWYDPGQLIITGLQTLLSALFAERADYRLIQALGELPAAHDYRDHPDLWLDYVADVGDGFNSTYAVARLLAADDLSADGVKLPRGRVLLMGGDQVYPTPSRARYEERLVRPYASALDADDTEHPLDLYAIPGNHDWYDGLVSFMNLFCHGRRIGAWQTPQKRSYFALRLPHHYWILGVDIQLKSDIDNPQIDYFLGLDIQPGDRIILATAEPDWVYGNIYERKTNLCVLEQRLVREKGAEIVLMVAGDQHHYRRHTLMPAEGKLGDMHLVTAGGGGAFLHPTHTHKVARISVGERGKKSTFALVAEYPDRATSQRLGLRNIAFFAYNPWFGLATGFAYTMLAWVMPPGRCKSSTLGAAAEELLMNGLTQIATSASCLAWVVVILLAFVAFTDTHRAIYRWIAGLLHGTAHLTAALVIATLTAGLIEPEGITSPILYRLVSSIMTFVGGYFGGALIMGIYLTISVCLFRRHGNEAFSSLKIEGYKNFLRMHLSADGLSVWAFGLDRVPAAGHWVWTKGSRRRARWEPSQRAPKLEPKIIDHFEIPAKR